MPLPRSDQQGPAQTSDSQPTESEPAPTARRGPYPVDGVIRLGERPEPGRGGLHTSQGEPRRQRR